eukprot:Opistho-2@89549
MRRTMTAILNPLAHQTMLNPSPKRVQHMREFSLDSWHSNTDDTFERTNSNRTSGNASPENVSVEMTDSDAEGDMRLHIARENARTETDRSSTFLLQDGDATADKAFHIEHRHAYNSGQYDGGKPTGRNDARLTSSMSAQDADPLVPFSKRHMWEILTIVILYSGYVGKYFVTSHLSVLKTLVQSDLEMTEMTWGSTAGAAYVVYSISKVIFGVLTDRYGGRVMWIFSLWGSSLMTLGFAIAPGPLMFILSWNFLYICLCPGWIALMKIVSRWVPPQRQGMISGLLSTSYLVGDESARFTLGILLSWGYQWRGIMVFCAIVAILLGIPALLYLWDGPSDVGFPELVKPTLPAHAKTSVTEVDIQQLQGEVGMTPHERFIHKIRTQLLHNEVFWLVCGLSTAVYLLRELFFAYSASYLQNVYCNWGRDCQDAASRNAAAAASAWGSMAFSLVGVASCLLVGYLKDRLPKKHRASLCISFLSVLVVGLAYLSANAEKMSFNGAIFLLAVCGWGLLGPYSLPGGAFSVDIGGRDLTGTANSLIDSAGALGAFAIMIIKGQMGERCVSVCRCGSSV